MACTHGPWARFEKVVARGIFAGLTIGPLVCTSCGVPWPGYPLPERPGHHIEPIGLAEHTSWRSRVRAALDSIGPRTHPGR